MKDKKVLANGKLTSKFVLFEKRFDVIDAINAYVQRTS